MPAITQSRADAAAHRTSPARRTTRSRRLAGLAAAALLALAAPFGAASPALAHDELVATDLVLNPADDSLDAFELSFSNTVMDVGTEIKVTDENGADATGGAAPELSGTVVRQPLAADLPSGDYEVVWRVVSSDGHPIEGTFGIMLRIAEDGSATDSAIMEQDPRSDHEHDGDEESGAAEEDHSDSENHDHADAEEADQGLPVWAIVLISIGGAAVLITAIAVIARKRRGAPWGAADADGSTDGDTDENTDGAGENSRKGEDS